MPVAAPQEAPYAWSISCQQQGLAVAQNSQESASSVEPFPELVQPRLVSDELNRIDRLLRGEFEFAARVSFEFNRRLLVHIDVRRREEANVVESRLVALGGGTLFSQVVCGNTPGHAFMHRISASVSR